MTVKELISLLNLVGDKTREIVILNGVDYEFASKLKEETMWNSNRLVPIECILIDFERKAVEVDLSIINQYLFGESFEGKQTTINFYGDLKMSEPWKSYTESDIFTIIRKAKSGLYIIKDNNGNEYSLNKSNINYFKQVKPTTS